MEGWEGCDEAIWSIYIEIAVSWIFNESIACWQHRLFYLYWEMTSFLTPHRKKNAAVSFNFILNGSNLSHNNSFRLRAATKNLTFDISSFKTMDSIKEWKHWVLTAMVRWKLEWCWSNSIPKSSFKQSDMIQPFK